MATKLTLRMDENLINQAKKYAGRSGKSVSRLVADFFALLGRPSAGKESGISPKVRSLKGVLKGSSVEIKDYERHLEKKYL
jgi:hypothetical protein